MEADGERCKVNWKPSQSRRETVKEQKDLGESDSRRENKESRNTRQAKEKKSEWTFLSFFVSVARPSPSKYRTVYETLAGISSIHYENMEGHVLISITGYFLSRLQDYNNSILSA